MFSVTPTRLLSPYKLADLAKIPFVLAQTVKHVAVPHAWGNNKLALATAVYIEYKLVQTIAGFLGRHMEG